jgi:N-acetylneuraminic acid mutarotase
MANLPFKGGMSTSTRGKDSLIMFGGENATDSYTNNLYKLSQVGESFTWEILQQNNPPPGTLYGQSVITKDNNNMYLLGGMTNATNNQRVPFQSYQYSFPTSTWTASPNNNVNIANSTTLPLNRKLFSATFNGDSKAYIYGGALNATTVFNDFFTFDTTTQQYAPLPPTDIGRYGHSASLLR